MRWGNYIYPFLMANDPKNSQILSSTITFDLVDRFEKFQSQNLCIRRSPNDCWPYRCDGVTVVTPFVRESGEKTSNSHIFAITWSILVNDALKDCFYGMPNPLIPLLRRLRKGVIQYPISNYPAVGRKLQMTISSPFFSRFGWIQYRNSGFLTSRIHCDHFQDVCVKG